MDEYTPIRVESIVNTHCHLRDGSARKRALIDKNVQGGVDTILAMPNPTPTLVLPDLLAAYTEELVSHSRMAYENKVKFIPTAMLTENTTVAVMIAFAEMGCFDFKIYPFDRTTNSKDGVIRYFRVIEVIREAARIILERHGKNIRIHVHPEHPNLEFINRDAEFVFAPIVYMMLEETTDIIFWEHGTDSRCIPLWKDMADRFPGRFYLTLTAHHLATDEDRTFGDPCAACKPSIKTAYDRRALIALVYEDHYWVLAGADDAPHPIEKKHVEVGRPACGDYTAPFMVLLYAHALKEIVLDPIRRRIFVNFTSRNARRAFGLEKPVWSIDLQVRDFEIPLRYNIADWSVKPFGAGTKLLFDFATHVHDRPLYFAE